MHPRAAHLIAALHLQPHPEGGYFQEIYRADAFVHPADERPERAALTTIYFLLTEGEVSRWHRVASDEVWHFYEGEALTLLQADPGFDTITTYGLGPYNDDVQPVQVVPAGMWQAAQSTGAYTLVGCTVGPGFDFVDFEMLRDLPAMAESVRQKQPRWASFI